MKKTVLLSLAVFLLLAGAGILLLVLPARGVLRTDGPAETVQHWLDARDAVWLRQEYVRLHTPEVTEFENAGQVAAAIYDAAAGDRFSFRELPGSGSERAQDYILSAGDADILLLSARFENGVWQVETGPLNALTGERRTLSVTVPEDAALTLNGVPVSESYIAERGLPYPDLTELEQRFDGVPSRVRYAIPGMYGAAELEAWRQDGLLLLRSDGTEWEYTLPDAAGHSFSVTAPRDALVTVCGALLDEGDVTATRAWPTKLDIPAELQEYLPESLIYTAGGLYSVPEIDVKAADGGLLECAGTGTELVFSPAGSEALHDACHERVRSFLWALCDYGAGHGDRGYPCVYTVNPSPLSRYIWNAGDSLTWTVGVTLKFSDIQTSDYIPLGDDAFLCRGHVDVTSITRHETQDLSLDYEMLWIRKNGYWYCQDLAFA
ncbi:MAG: hypothetical protein IJH47_08545 [Oscillospiraceae bacterium]|nr:hypothetical protein [Oscillospiraceae bacterium]